MSQANRTPAWIPVVAAAWFLVVVGAGGSGRLAGLQPPTPQLSLLGLTVILIVLGRAVPSLRAWLDRVDPRAGIALHLTRFIGIYFLVLFGRGELPFAFAVPGGIGDIVVAALAAGLLVWPPAPRWRAAALAWNVVGLIDLLFVVATAARVAWRDPASMAALLRLPLAVLPFFLVPLLLASHVWLFGRLRVMAGPGNRPGAREARA